MTVSRRNFLAGSAGVGVTSFLIAACGNSASKSSSTGSGDTTTLVEAVAGLPTGFSFDTSPSGYENMEFTNNNHACLIRNPYVSNSRSPNSLKQDTYKFEGVLVDSYDVSADGLEYTFNLRKGVLSQKGNPFTAEDVLFSYQRKFHSTSITPFVTSPAITNPSKQFSKVDDHTVRITVQRKSDGFTLLALLANVTSQIYDSTYLKSVATKSDPYGLTASNA
ncbi:MAG: ABC transporter substrate-binding protein, partial [Gordonia sp. (in: high G+C Gram-positive bacteria)]